MSSTDPPSAADDGPSRPDRPGVANLVAALHVVRNAKVGVAVGVALAAAMYAVRVFELVGPFAGTREFPVLGAAGWYLVLALVLAWTSALLVTTLLTLVLVYWFLRSL